MTVKGNYQSRWRKSHAAGAGATERETPVPLVQDEQDGSQVTAEHQQATWDAERKLRAEDRARKLALQDKVADMTPEQRQDLFIRLLDSTPWPRQVCDSIGISRAVPYYWARTVDAVRKALKQAAGTRQEWAVEEIDEIAHGIVSAGQWRLQALQWRAGRGAMGEWLGDGNVSPGETVNVFNLISNIPRPEIPQPEKLITIPQETNGNTD